MKRDTLITILLVIAGIVLALALFGAGVLWKGRASPRSIGRVRPGPALSRVRSGRFRPLGGLECEQ